MVASSLLIASATLTQASKDLQPHHYNDCYLFVNIEWVQSLHYDQHSQHLHPISQLQQLVSQA